MLDLSRLPKHLQEKTKILQQSLEIAYWENILFPELGFCTFTC